MYFDCAVQPLSSPNQHQQSKFNSPWLIALSMLAVGCGANTAVPPNSASKSVNPADSTQSVQPAADADAKGSERQPDTTTTDAVAAAQTDTSNAKHQKSPDKQVAQADLKKETFKAPPAKAGATPTAEQLAKWAIVEFQPLQLLACHDDFEDGFITSMALSPDGKQFALGGAKLTLWNTNESKPIVNLIEGIQGKEIERPIRCVAFSPNGELLAAGDQKGTLRIWRVADQSLTATMKAHDGHMRALAFSPNSQTIATTSYSGEVLLWNAADGKKIKGVKVDKQELVQLAFLSDAQLATAGRETNIWNIESGKKEQTLTSGQVIGPALGLSSDRQRLAFSDGDAGLRIWDAQKSSAIGEAMKGGGNHLIEFSSDNKWLANYGQHVDLRIVDAATGQIVQVIDADGGRVSELHWLPNLNALLVASEQDRVRLWGTADVAKTLGIEPISLPVPKPIAADGKQPLNPAQALSIIDIRSFPRLPGAVPQYGDGIGMTSYSAPVTLKDAELFYRYFLGKAGWSETGKIEGAIPALTFSKSNCELNISFMPAAMAGVGKEGDHVISLMFTGNYDVRKLPKFEPIETKGEFSSFSTSIYRTKASLLDLEVAILKQFHAAGWTAYTRLNASGNEEPESRMISWLQSGGVLSAFIRRPADSNDQFAVQLGIGLSSKSLPIPPDSGWIEFDSSTDLNMVANTKMKMQQTAEFYDKEMAADGWLSRESGRFFKDDRGWLPYIQGQRDVLIRLVERPEGGTRIIVGDAERSSWQLQKAKDSAKAKTDKKESAKPGIEAADFELPKGAKSVSFDVDQKKIEFEFPDATPPQLADLLAKQMESIGWPRDKSGVVSDEYTLATYIKDKIEIQLRARSQNKKTTAMISGDGLLWNKALPTAPVRISFGTWLQRNLKDATLELIDEYTDQMKKIPASDGKN